MARKNEDDEMLLFNPGYLFRFKEKKSSKLAMEKRHFIWLLFFMTGFMIFLWLLEYGGWLKFY